MIGAFFMLAQVVPVPSDPKPVPATIVELRANPKKFDGRIVRLHGYVNRCSSLDCSIAERLTTDPRGMGQLISIASDARFDATLRPLVPTYVEFDARVDATCLVQVCLDRAPVLSIVSLRAVVSPEPPPFEKP